MTIYSTRGNPVKLAKETALGTYAEADFEGATEANGGALHVDGELKFPYTNHVGADNPNTGHAIWASIADKPVVYKTALKDSLTIPARIRPQLGTVGTEVPPIIRYFKSCGCTCTLGTAAGTTVTTATQSSIVAAADILGKGYGGLVGMGAANVKGFFPFLVHTDAAGTYTPWMQFPADDVADGNKLWPMHTVYPTINEYTAGTSLAFRTIYRGQHTTAPDLAYTASGCVLSKVPPFKITPLGIPQLDFVFHVCNVELSSETTYWTDGTHMDDARFVTPFGTSSCNLTLRPRCGFAAHNTLGAIGSAYAPFVEAEVDLGINTLMVEEGGGDTGVHGAQTFIQSYTTPSVTLTWPVDIDVAKTWETQRTTPDSLLDYYLEFAMPTMDPTKNPAFLLAFPKMRMAGWPEQDYYGPDMLKMKVKFIASACQDLDVTPDAIDAAPWFLSLSSKYIAP